jgi:hypothetical protein
MSSRKPGQRTLSGILIFATSLMAGSITAAPARADSVAYINNLHSLGISPPGGDAELKEWGWEVCALFQMGFRPEKVLQQSVYNSQNTPPYGMSVGQANAVVDHAVSDLCADRK